MKNKINLRDKNINFESIKNIEKNIHGPSIFKEASGEFSNNHKKVSHPFRCMYLMIHSVFVCAWGQATQTYIHIDLHHLHHPYRDTLFILILSQSNIFTTSYVCMCLNTREKKNRSGEKKILFNMKKILQSSFQNISAKVINENAMKSSLGFYFNSMKLYVNI